MATKRKPNEFYEAAAEATDIMNPHPALRQSVLDKNLQHLSMLCGKKAIEAGAKPYNAKDVIECWKELRERIAEARDRGANLSDPSLLAVVTPEGGQPRIQTWIKDRLSAIPPVYDEAAHDDFVRDHAEFLARHNFEYQPIDQFGRLTTDDLIDLGLIKPAATRQLGLFEEA